jgi:hypothetical protein
MFSLEQPWGPHQHRHHVSEPAGPSKAGEKKLREARKDALLKSSGALQAVAMDFSTAAHSMCS